MLNALYEVLYLETRLLHSLHTVYVTEFWKTVDIRTAVLS